MATAIGQKENRAADENVPSTRRPDQSTTPGSPSQAESASPSANAESSPGPSVSDRLTTNAVQLIKAGQTELALEQLQQAILIDQDNREAIFRVMSILDDRGLQKIQAGDPSGGYADLRVAGIFARRIVARGMLEGLPQKQRGWVANALYNEACARCFGGETGLALVSLSMALETGFDRPELIETDPDLDRIRATPIFAQLVQKYVRSDQTR